MDGKWYLTNVIEIVPVDNFADHSDVPNVKVGAFVLLIFVHSKLYFSSHCHLNSTVFKF